MPTSNSDHLSALYGADKFGLSFELFPPKTAAGEKALFQNVERLMDFQPSYITCTYGAGGSTRSKTLEIVEEVKKRFQVPVASHLTCVGATADELRDYLKKANERGVDYIVALRGDPPKGETSFKSIEGGLNYGNELVSLIRSEFGSQFGVAVAGYPETHQEAPSPDEDLSNLRRKVDAGADVVITQLFYDNPDYFTFRERCEKAGIAVPIVPGLLPVTNLSQIQRITSLCGARLPKDFIAKLSEREDDADWQFKVGVEQATAQTQELIDQGAPGIHFYVLNKSKATSQVLEGVNWHRFVDSLGVA